MYTQTGVLTCPATAETIYFGEDVIEHRDSGHPIPLTCEDTYCDVWSWVETFRNDLGTTAMRCWASLASASFWLLVDDINGWHPLVVVWLISRARCYENEHVHRCIILCVLWSARSGWRKRSLYCYPLCLGGTSATVQLAQRLQAASLHVDYWGDTSCLREHCWPALATAEPACTSLQTTLWPHSLKVRQAWNVITVWHTVCEINPWSNASCCIVELCALSHSPGRVPAPYAHGVNTCWACTITQQHHLDPCIPNCCRPPSDTQKPLQRNQVVGQIPEGCAWPCRCRWEPN